MGGSGVTLTAWFRRHGARDQRQRRRVQ
jgi:hypothetical protein